SPVESVEVSFFRVFKDVKFRNSYIKEARLEALILEQSHVMQKPKLLYYLDDDSDDLYFFKIAAQSLGQNFSLFLSGYDMLQSLRTAKHKPDIIFLDLHMPVLNGEEILNILKNSKEFR